MANAQRAQAKFVREVFDLVAIERSGVDIHPGDIDRQKTVLRVGEFYQDNTPSTSGVARSRPIIQSQLTTSVITTALESQGYDLKRIFTGEIQKSRAFLPQKFDRTGENSPSISIDVPRTENESLLASISELQTKLSAVTSRLESSDKSEILKAINQSPEFVRLIHKFYWAVAKSNLPPRLSDAEFAALRKHAKAHPWSKREKRFEKPHDFIARVYKNWIGKLSRPHIAIIDPLLANALNKWLVENKLPKDLDLPAKAEVTDREARALGLLDNEVAIEVGARLHARAITQLLRSE